LRAKEFSRAATSAQRAITMVGNCANPNLQWNCAISEAEKSTSSQSILSLVQNGLSISGSADLAPCDRTLFLCQRRLQHHIEVRRVTRNLEGGHYDNKKN
jgi:hypothetical protein